MEQRAIGSLSALIVGLGCNQLGTTLDAAASANIVERALDLGVTFFDTAEEYGDGASEEALGKALGPRRRDVVIATKFAGHVDGVPVPGRGRAAAVVEACERSLRRLGSDYIDLYQLHFPDPATPIDETLAALDRLVREGKVREIGCCNLSGAEIGAAAQAAEAGGLHRFACAQNRLNLLRQESLDEVVPACMRHGMGFLPYFPLAAGVLTGKYRRGQPPPADTRLGSNVAPEVARRVLNARALDRVDALAAYARRSAHSVAELAIAWLASQPFVSSVIAGATRPQQVEANVAAAGWRLTPGEVAEAGRVGRGEVAHA